MTEFTVKVIDNDGKNVANATVTAKKKDWITDIERKQEATTNHNGIVTFQGDWFTTYNVEASHNGEYDSGSVRIDANTVTPEVLTLQLFFNPTKKVAKIFGTAGEELVKNTRTLSIGFAVVGSAVVVIYLLNKASSKSVPTVKVPKVNLRK